VLLFAGAAVVSLFASWLLVSRLGGWPSPPGFPRHDADRGPLGMPVQVTWLHQQVRAAVMTGCRLAAGIARQAPGADQDTVRAAARNGAQPVQQPPGGCRRTGRTGRRLQLRG